MASEDIATTGDLMECIAAHNVRSSILTTRKKTGEWSNFWERELKNNQNFQDGLVTAFNATLEVVPDTDAEGLRDELEAAIVMKIISYRRVIQDFGLNEAEKKILSETSSCSHALVHKSSMNGITPRITDFT